MALVDQNNQIILAIQYEGEMIKNVATEYAHVE